MCRPRTWHQDFRAVSMSPLTSLARSASVSSGPCSSVRNMGACDQQGRLVMSAQHQHTLLSESPERGTPGSRKEVIDCLAVRSMQIMLS